MQTINPDMFEREKSIA